jgi:hypothetical protein
MARQQPSLRTLLLGTPLWERDENDMLKIAAGINAHLFALLELMPNIYGDNEPCRQAVLEVGTISDMRATRTGVTCKRAMLLYALATENETCNHWKCSESHDAELAIDLKQRVLPFLTPRFFKDNCQSPGSFVILAAMLTEMWRGEDLGNFRAAHHDCTGGQLHK